jgi:predicted RNA-binding protein with PUA-like domain
MNFWLLKTEPETFSWDMQKKKGAKGEPWSGVRNHTAKRNMMAMKKGDLGFFLSHGEEKAVVGIVEVIGEYRPDPTDEKAFSGWWSSRRSRTYAQARELGGLQGQSKLKDMSLVHLAASVGAAGHRRPSGKKSAEWVDEVARTSLRLHARRHRENRGRGRSGYSPPWH